MLPITLNLQLLDIALIGQGENLLKRQKKLIEAGAKNLQIFGEDEISDLQKLKDFHLLLLVDVDNKKRDEIVNFARKEKILINVEDVTPDCDFYYSSFIKRGDLLIAVNSGGKSPTLTQRIRDHIAKIFSNDWEGILEEMALQRLKWRKDGLSMAEVKLKSDEYINKQGWFDV